MPQFSYVVSSEWIETTRSNSFFIFLSRNEIEDFDETSVTKQALKSGSIEI